MKKYLIIFLIIFFVCSPAMAFAPKEFTASSGEQTGDALILTGKGYFAQLLIMPDGTNNVTVSVYDNTSASGSKFIPTMTFAGNGGAQATPPIWVEANTGIYVDVTLAAGTVAYAVLYRSR